MTLHQSATPIGATKTFLLVLNTRTDLAIFTVLERPEWESLRYWDRIGDTLSFYFPNKMKPNSIYLGKVIESIPAKYRRSSNYGWLNDFKNNQYNKLMAFEK